MSKIKCPSCSWEIIDSDVHLKINNCPHCQKSYRINQTLVTDHKNVSNSDGISTEIQIDNLNMIVKWSTVTNWSFSLIFGLIFTILMAGMLALMWFQNSILAMMFFGMIVFIFLGLGLYLIYQALFEFFNKTNIHISPEYIVVNHLFHDKYIQSFRIHTSDLVQVFVRRKDGGSNGSKRYYYHEIFLKTRSGQQFLIANKIKDPATAYHIETTIEDFIGISDRVVSHEFQSDQNPFSDEDIMKNEVAVTLVNETMSHKNINVIPEKFMIYSNDISILDVSWKTKNNKAIAFLIFGILIATFLVFTSSKNLLFQMIMTSVSLVMISNATLSLLRKYSIRITDNYLWVDNFPTVFFQTKSTEYDIDDIKQLYVAQKMVKNGDTNRVHYQLILVDKQDEDHVLINHYENAADLFFVERKIESILGIADVFVDGEYNPEIKSIPQDVTEYINLTRELMEKN